MKDYLIGRAQEKFDEKVGQLNSSEQLLEFQKVVILRVEHAVVPIMIE